MKTEEKYEERIQRVKDAIALKEPDRVPITPFADVFFAALQVGMTHKDVMYKGRKVGKASLKVFSRYDWDLYPYIPSAGMGGIFDLVGNRTMKWAGAADPEFRLGDHQPFQIIEKTWMAAEEYEDLIGDLTGYLIRKIVPRHNATLGAFQSFPPATLLATNYSGLGAIMFFMNKDVKKMIKTLKKSLLKMIGTFLGTRKYNNGMKKKGNPIAGSGITTVAPFDLASAYLRGMRGIMLDMYRNPEELKKVCDLLAKAELDSLDALSALTSMPGASDDNTISLSFVPLNRGADGFMNNDQFAEFYWPGLTKTLEGMIAKGITPMPFFEGRYNDRLEFLAEFAKKHKGKLVYWFHDTDIIKVKEMMGDYVCIRGNVPASLLIGGPPKAVDEYVKKCIEGCMEGGGYLVDGGVSGIPNEARHENVQAMTDAVHKYGVYRK
ncbi:MAG: uroporphyrinogen decarboxylase family protein [Promethearchaeota archaeon]